MPTFEKSLIINRGTSAPLSKTVSLTADGETIREVTIAGEASDVLVSLNIDVSHLKQIVISSDKAGVVIETNSSSDPQESITLGANDPFEWSDNGYFPDPFEGDVTAIYITNSTVGAANVKIWVLQDSTPA